MEINWALGFVIVLPKLSSLYVPHMVMSIEMIQMDWSWQTLIVLMALPKNVMTYDYKIIMGGWFRLIRIYGNLVVCALLEQLISLL